MKATIFRYSLWAGGILILMGLINWLFIAKPFGFQAAEIIGYASMILALSMIFFAIRHFRTHYGNGNVSFGQGFRIGIFITLITSGVFYVYTAAYFAIWGADFKEWADVHYKEAMSPEQYQTFVTQMEQPLYNSAAFQGLVMFMTVFFIGLIITLISAMVLKKG